MQSPVLSVIEQMAFLNVLLKKLSSSDNVNTTLVGEIRDLEQSVSNTIADVLQNKESLSSSDLDALNKQVEQLLSGKSLMPVAAMNSDESDKNVVYLSQKDLETRGIVINKPGRYVLTENLVHDVLSDKDRQFTQTGKINARFIGGARIEEQHFAILVQSDNVELDLNGFSIEQSHRMYKEQRVYAHIELAQSLFGNVINFFPGTEAPLGRSPQNIKIHNGTLGLSSHFSIHGTDNANVEIKDLVINEYDVAGIWINNSINCVIENCIITGLLKMTQPQLQMAAFGPVGTGQKGVVDSNMWGINLNEKFGNASSRAPSSSDGLGLVEGLRDGSDNNNSQRVGPRNCIVRNCQISNIEMRATRVHFHARLTDAGDEVFVLGSQRNGGHTSSLSLVTEDELLEAVGDGKAKYYNKTLAKIAFGRFKVTAIDGAVDFKYVKAVDVSDDTTTTFENVVVTGDTEVTTSLHFVALDLSDGTGTVEVVHLFNKGQLLPNDVRYVQDGDYLETLHDAQPLNDGDYETHKKNCTFMILYKDEDGDFPLQDNDTVLVSQAGKVAEDNTLELTDYTAEDRLSTTQLDRLFVSDVLGKNDWTQDPNGMVIGFDVVNGTLQTMMRRVPRVVNHMEVTAEDGSLSYVPATGRGERFPGDIVQFLNKEKSNGDWAVAKAMLTTIRGSGVDAAHHAIAGNFGLEMGRANGCLVEDVMISNVLNISEDAAYGGHPWGVFLSDCEGNTLRNVTVSNTMSALKAAAALPFHLSRGSRGNLVENCHVRGVTASDDSGSNAAFGFINDDGSRSNIYRGCSVQHLQSYLSAAGFVMDGPGNLVEDCQVSGVNIIEREGGTTSTVNAGGFISGSRTFGASRGGANNAGNKFVNCSVNNIVNNGTVPVDLDEGETPPQMKSFGVYLNSSDDMVDNCRINNIKSNGLSSGIHVHSSNNAVLKSNTVHDVKGKDVVGMNSGAVSGLIAMKNLVTNLNGETAEFYSSLIDLTAVGNTLSELQSAPNKDNAYVNTGLNKTATGAAP